MRILIAVAHADDETLGCSTLLGRPDVHLLHVTDSAPRDLRFARKAGFETREAYREARRAEVLDMLRMAGVPEEHYHCLGFADQEAPLYTGRIREFVASFGADRIYTHAYEGGHPDHDAIACALNGLPNIWEFPLYHGWGGDFVPHSFLCGEPAEIRVLTGADRARKQALLACFRSQAPIIDKFRVEREQFRPAPAYDFSAPPHEGALYYEVRQLGWEWPRWREAVTSPSPSAVP